MRSTLAVSFIALLAATPALAQEGAGAAQPAPAPAPDPGDTTLSEGEIDEIVVIASRVRGQVETASAPVLELDQQQVQAYGAASIADLVAQLAPAVGSGNGRGGRAVILVNGQRVANFREIGRYPPEAIKKVEVLPEEVALKFGYPASQRVINFILQDNYASREIELEAGAPTRGGYATGGAELGLLQINGPQRLNATLSYEATSPLTEGERGIVQTPGSNPTDPNDLDPADFRTLVAQREQLEANVTGTYGLGESGSAGQLTLNSQWIHNRSTSLSGLDLETIGSTIRVIDANPIERRTNADTLALGAGYSTRFGTYQFQTTVDAGLTDTESRIDQRRNAPGPVISDLARSKVWSASTRSTLIGNPFVLPAGELGVTLNAGYDWDRIDSFDTRTAAGNTTLTRGDLSAGANISLPVASRRDDVWAAIGDLTVNLSGGVNHLSDFGTLGNVTGGVVWNPAERLTLQSTYTVRQAAPGLGQLGGPTILNFNVPVYDFRANETVLVTQTSGGNPFLSAETQRDLKLSANYDIDFLDRTNVLVEYYNTRSSDVTSSFPLLTPAIEAAFPNRITRDAATGRLTAIDVRPVTFSEVRSQRLRYGINLFGKLGKPLPESERGRGGGFGAMMGRGVGAPTPASGTTPAPAPAGQGAAAGGVRGGTAQMSMEPERFRQLREQFCASPAGTVPDLSALPQQMQDRVKGEDGKVDPARVAVLRERVCSADAQRRFDPARFTAMRTALCADLTKDPDPAAIPDEIRNRLSGPDGSIAPERLKEFRDRICALPTGESGQRDQGGQRRQGVSGGPSSAGEGGGPVVIVAAPASAPGTGGSPTTGGGQRGGGGFGPMGGGGDGQGRWNASLYHTVNLANEVLIAPGGPFLNLLGGDATGGGGGVSRHLIELEGGGFYRGIGLRLSGNYQSATTVRGTGLPGSSDLFFDDLATFNLRAFVALDQQKWLVGEGDAGFFKNARLSLRVNNIFDTRQRITDGNGDVPLRYQPFLVDPVGRLFEVELRKLF